MDAVLARLGHTTDYVIDDGHIWTHGLGEQRRYAIQHTLRHQIWELDQPHYLHAHVRSPLGHTPDPSQAAARHTGSCRLDGCGVDPGPVPCGSLLARTAALANAFRPASLALVAAVSLRVDVAGQHTVHQ
jgi:hypothetical protein